MDLEEMDMPMDTENFQLDFKNTPNFPSLIVKEEEVRLTGEN